MSDEYNEADDDDGDEAIHVNFAGVGPRQERKAWHPLPAGKYIAEVTDYTKSKVTGGKAENRGAPMYNWEFTLESLENGDETIVANVRDPETQERVEQEMKIPGRRVFDNMVVVQSSYWRMRDFLDACGYDTTGSINFIPSQMLGERLILELTPQREKKDRKTGDVYKARNRIVAFFPLEGEMPTHEDDQPQAEQLPADPPEEEKKSRRNKKDAEPAEEASV